MGVSPLFSFILFALSASADPLPLDTMRYIDIQQFLSETNRGLQSLSGRVESCGREGFAAPSSEILSWSRHRVSAFTCEQRDPQVFYESMCREALGYCERSSGQAHCWNPTPDRFRNELTRQEVFSRTFQIFNGITHNPEVLDRCCFGHADPTACRIAFANTRLNIVQGMAFDSYLAFYLIPSVVGVPPSGLYLSEGRLLGCRNVACIQHMLYHELGHRCSSLKWMPQGGGFDMESWGHAIWDVHISTTSDDCSSGNSTRQQLERFIGAETWQCIERRMREQGKRCHSARLEEILADAIFLPRWRYLEHYATNCRGIEDDEHMHPSVYMPCLVNTPAQREILCGRRPSTTASPAPTAAGARTTQ